VTFEPGEHGPVAVPSASGGLATGLQGLPQLGRQGAWVCAVRSEQDRQVSEAAEGRTVVVQLRDEDQSVRFVVLDEEDKRLTLTVAANPILWFIHHSLWGLAEQPAFGPDEHLAFEAYARVNEAFADAVVEELDRLGPDTVVMLHDYQLYLVAGYVRARRPEAFLHHFVHVPFPPPEIWQGLPVDLARSLLEGLLANDVVAFHTPAYVANFVETCVAVLGAAIDTEVGGVRHAGRRTAVRAYPLSPSPETLHEIVEDPATCAERAELLRYRPAKLIVRVDRADPSKNLLRGFAAFALLLETHPEHRGRAVFLALIQPTREEVEVYRDYAVSVVEAAQAVNERFATPDWTPVVLLEGEGRERALAALQEYDVLLANSVRDGMNLVVKEGVLLNERDGVLVLSREIGAYDELKDCALGVHPLDVSDQAAMLHVALAMPRDERHRWLETARAQLVARGTTEWFREQLRDVDALRAGALTP
jgi:trehalose 6-phosphate synthase